MLVCAAVVLAQTADRALATPLVSVQPASSSANVGDNFVVEIAITGAVDLYAFQFDLAFGSTVISLVSQAEGAFLPSFGPTFFVDGTVDNVAGLVSTIADSLSGPITGGSGDGVLVALTFNALAAGTSSLTLLNVILLDSALSEIAFNVQNGSARIGGGSIPEPAVVALVLLALAVLIAARTRSRRLDRARPA